MSACCRRAFLYGCAGLPLWLAACTPVRNPVTGNLDFTLLDPEEEAKIGREEHSKVLAHYGGAYEDPRLQAYVREIGERLVAVSELPGASFTFTLLDSPKVNAFALPGGYVYVTRGLLALADDEAELAGVLGHEIGHIAARHVAKRYDRTVHTQIAFMSLGILAYLYLGEMGVRPIEKLATAWMRMFSREEELEADELGIRYLTRAGYDPTAVASLLTAFEQWERVFKDESEQTPSWLASHPSPDARARQATKQAASVDAAGERRRDAYLALIDGMIFGDSPRHGLVLARQFVHPELGFRFEVPEGFAIRNSPQYLLARASDETFLVFDLVRPTPGRTLEDHLLTDLYFGRSTGGLERWHTADGLPVLATPFRARFRGGPIFGVAAIVDDGQETLKRWRLVAPQSDDGVWQFVRQTTSSYRRLEPAEAAQFRPLRIRVERLAGGESATELAARMEVESGALELFQILNDYAGPADGVPGRAVKLVTRS
ncbi:Beta-barrel assembly-enhancing protease [bacterium HR40]|nr:Beta-barrel assembly-enhancing protease [bacterium HR40]